MSALEKLRGRWLNRTVACIASGPSLQLSDVEAIRAARIPTLVCNNNFRLAPWADLLYAMDAAWWRHYGKEARETFKGELWSHVRAEGCNHTKGDLYPKGYGNSGSYLVSLAIVSQASTILLTGYDCCFAASGAKHHHPDHPKELGNCGRIASWPYHFELVSKYARTHNVRIVNCSRSTELKCFERGVLEEELAKLHA